MKGDLHPAAVRLMQSLPVHTHARPEPTRKTYTRKVEVPPAGKIERRNRPVKIRGHVYPSLKAARADLRIGKAKMWRWIDDGTAVLV